MARQQCPQHSCTCNVPQPLDNTNATMTANTSLIHRDLLNLPFQDHPLFRLRKCTIIVALIGLLLTAAATQGYSDPSSPIGFLILMLIFSILFCVADLVAYARKKASNPEDEKPKWPKTKFIFCDFLLAVILFVTSWCCIAFLASSSWYYVGPNIVVVAYGALGGLGCSVLHAVACWKQIMARKRQAWLAALPQEPCARCGYTQTRDESAAQQQPQPHPGRDSQSQTQPNVFPYIGPSADFQEANILTPEQSESAMEEGLLIGSDFEGGYQTMLRDNETIIEQPEGIIVVKAKSKGKKKAVGRADSGSSDGRDQGDSTCTKTAS